MRFVKATLIGMLALVGLSACAFVDNQVQLEAQQVADLPAEAGNGSTVYLALLEDARTDKAKVGVIRNGFGAETAAVNTADKPAIWVSNSLKSNLEKAGYKVETVDGGFRPAGDQFLLSGNLTRTFSDPKVGFWAFTVTGDVEAIMKAEYAGRTTQATIAGHHEQMSMVSSGGEMHKGSLNNALQDFVRKVIDWLGELRGAKPAS